MQAIYSERWGPAAWVWLVALAIAVVSVFGAVDAGSIWAAVIPTTAVAGLFALLQERIEVRPEELVVSLRPFRRRRVPLRSISGLEVIEYRPLLDYGGWGIRYSFKNNGWAYTISGNRGVMLHLDSGKSLLVGTGTPEQLAAAIQGARRTGSTEGPARV